MRRVPVFLAATLLVAAAFPSVAGAHPVERYSDDHVVVSCDLFGGDSGAASFYAEVSTNFGSYAGLAFWMPPATPDSAPPTWISGDATVDLADGSTLSVTLDMYEYSEEPTPEPPAFIGVATVAADLEPVGDPEPFAYEDQGSNQQFRVEGVSQMLSVSGEALLPGDVALELDNCYAVHETVSVFATNPDAYVSRSSAVSLSCSWELDGMFATLSAYAEGGYASADMFIDSEGAGFYGGGDATLTDQAFAASFDLFDAGAPEPEPTGIGIAAVGPGSGDPVGSVIASATLSATGERSRSSDRFGWEKYTVRSERLAVSGSAEITLPGTELSLVMDDVSCYAEKVRFQYRSATPNEHAKGPGGGKPLPNDLPENATPLDVPTSLTLKSTAGTALDPEAPCIVSDEFGEFEVPIGHTAWWTFDGTGGDVTADTAGSAFDTVAGIYVQGEDGLTQVGCVDDVFVEPDSGSLQAAITVATDAGVTYYLQVGGFGGTTGQLELAVY